MSMKVSFFVCLSSFIGSISCEKFIPFNSVPYVPRKEYFLSSPTVKLDLSNATANCLALQMTLATVDDFQEQDILLYELRKDFARYRIFGPSEFWLVGPNGLNELKPLLRSVAPDPYGYSILAPTNGSSPKCVKLVFTSFYVGWVDDDCHGRYRFICTGKPYSMRSAPNTLLKQKIYEYALSAALSVIKMFKPKLQSEKEFTEDDISKMLIIVRDDLVNLTKTDDLLPVCEHFSKLSDLAAPESCGLPIGKASAMLIRLFLKVPYDLKTDMKTIIPKIEEGLKWSQEKAKKAVDMMIEAITDQTKNTTSIL